MSAHAARDRRTALHHRHARCSLACSASASIAIAWRLRRRPRRGDRRSTTAIRSGLWIAFDVVTGTALACGGYAVGAPGLHPQQGQVPPAGAAGDADQRARLHARRRRRRSRRRPLVEHVEGAALLLALELQLGAARSRALHHGLHRACCGSSCRRRSSRRAAQTVPTRGWRRSRAHVQPIIDKLLDLDHRARPAAADDAPVVARHADAARRTAAAHPLWHTPLLPLLFLVSCIVDGLRRRRVRVGVLERGVQARSRRSRCSRGLAGAMVPTLWIVVVLRLGDLALARAARRAVRRTTAAA